MLPLRDNVPTRRFPVVTVALIVANVLVFVLYQRAGEGPGFLSSVNDLAFRPCEVDDSCETAGEGPLVTLFTSMFLHGTWLHLLGNMLFLWIFGNNVEDTLGRPRYIAFYVLGGVFAMATQSAVTLGFGDPADGAIPNLGASGAIAAVLGAYFVLFPRGRVLTLILPVFIFPLPASLFLGIYFVMQALVGGLSFLSPEQGGGVAYFAHIGGIVFGILTIRLFAAGRSRSRY
ncbi:MAG TPA: rhomboid family intramembrane serine protease [Gaiellaceae bacterium]|nr:rhomboid family intramembrane serine protease [Gaiellaceae bacterium]